MAPMGTSSNKINRLNQYTQLWSPINILNTKCTVPPLCHSRISKQNGNRVHAHAKAPLKALTTNSTK